jgi:enamine deaminase RidA (YjgF/YER057c/UK114 family)
MLGPVGGRILFVAAQNASEPEGVVTEGDFVEQFSIALGKAVTVVREAGGGPEDVGRLTLFVSDMDEYRARRGEIREVHRAHMGRHYPALAVVQVSAFVDPEAQVEVDATAVIQDFSAPVADTLRPSSGAGGAE